MNPDFSLLKMEPMYNINELNKTKMIFIAHRGESRDAPENTLAAVNLAWQRDVDAVEVDVHLSKDGKIMVIHDDHVSLSGGTSKKVSELTLDELKQLDVGKFKADQWINERIPTLEQVLLTVPTSKVIFIEIKVGTEIMAELQRVISQSQLRPEQIKIIGFDREVMIKAREELDELEIFWVRNISYLEMKKNWRRDIKRIIADACDARLHGLDFSNSKVINKKMVSTVKRTGLKFFVWTVNDPLDAARLMEAGVDGIASDCARWLKNQVEILKTNNN